MIMSAEIEDNTYEPHKSTQANIPLIDSKRGLKVSSGGNYTDESGQQWICDTLVKYADGTGKHIQRIYHETITADDIMSVDIRYVQYGTVVTVAGLSKSPIINNDEVIIISNKAIGVSYNQRATTENASTYRVYLSSTGAKTCYFRYPASAGEVTLEQAKEDFAGAEISYILAEPIETDLTAEQMAEIEKLQTFNHITTVYTDDIGDVGIQYYKNNANADVVAQGYQSISVKAESMITQSAEQIKAEVSKTYTTKSELEDSVKSLQDQIDGALGSYSGSEVPTLNNYPANEWTTTAMKDAAIGSLYFVNSEGG
jgi:hypothetical protein